MKRYAGLIGNYKSYWIKSQQDNKLIIDSDYYNNSDNEGHIMFQVYNITDKDVFLPEGERIGQGVFLKYEITDDDVAEKWREGGFGSTDALDTFKNLLFPAT